MLPTWLRRPTGDRPRSWGADLAVTVALVAAFYVVVLLASGGAGRGAGAPITLDYRDLPLYALYSTARMAAAYALSLSFSLVYAYLAAFNRHAERVLVPLLDILQSIPILSFLPTIVLALTNVFPHSSLGAEIASVVLVFTSQAWNLTFSFYNSLLTVPRELREVAQLYRLSWWQRFRQLELPYAAIGLVWNSMMSWAGGWFFLMAAEMFTLGDRSFQVPGLGSYLQRAAAAGDAPAIAAGILTLITVIVALDQLVWRPLIAWSERFKMELVGDQAPPRSVVLRVLRRSALVEWVQQQAVGPLVEAIDRRLCTPRAPAAQRRTTRGPQRRLTALAALAALTAVAALALWHAAGLLLRLPAREAAALPLAAGLTTLRVVAALAISTLWTVPVGVFIGVNRAWSDRLQPVVQILASVPASALFPVIVVALGGGLGYTSVLLMLLGTQWYVLFNVIAGAMALPQDLKEATALFRLGRVERWRTLILPGIFPYLVTGLITAAGGAWNAAIITEFVQAGNRTYTTFGLGSVIAQASQHAQYPLLLGATLALSLLVVGANRLLWRRLFRLAESRYTLL